jgi:hypothetical protein
MASLFEKVAVNVSALVVVVGFGMRVAVFEVSLLATHTGALVV